MALQEKVTSGRVYLHKEKTEMRDKYWMHSEDFTHENY